MSKTQDKIFSVPDFGEGKTYCRECDGRGWVKCEHTEREDGHCLDCGYNLAQDGPDWEPPEPDEDTLWPGRER